MARMIDTTDVREGDLVSFRRYASDYEVHSAYQPTPGAPVRFEVQDDDGDHQMYVITVPADEGVIVRLRGGERFGDDDLLHARTMRWS
jgi:hypothetical protein